MGKASKKDQMMEQVNALEVVKKIYRTKPGHIRLMDHVAARLFWDVF